MGDPMGDIDIPIIMGIATDTCATYFVSQTPSLCNTRQPIT